MLCVLVLGYSRPASQPPCAISCVKFITLPWWLAGWLLIWSTNIYGCLSVCRSKSRRKLLLLFLPPLSTTASSSASQPAIQSLTSHPLPLSLDVVFLARNSDLISQLDLIRERIIDVLHCLLNKDIRIRIRTWNLTRSSSHPPLPLPPPSLLGSTMNSKFETQTRTRET